MNRNRIDPAEISVLLSQIASGCLSLYGIVGLVKEMLSNVITMGHVMCMYILAFFLMSSIYVAGPMVRSMINKRKVHAERNRSKEEHYDSKQ